MADYSLKLVDHTGSDITTEWLGGLSKNLQKLINECFSNSGKTVGVTWGDGAESDNLIVHFVTKPSESWVQKKMPGKPIPDSKGGHTRMRSGKSCSEVYLLSSGNRATYVGYSKLMVHEALHNLFPYWSEDEMHATGGLAGSPPSHLTEKNKEMLVRGFSVKNAQFV